MTEKDEGVGKADVFVTEDNVGEFGELDTLAKYAAADLDGLRHLSRLDCCTDEHCAVTQGGITDGGVSGGRRLAAAGVELMTGVGNEINILYGVYIYCFLRTVSRSIFCSFVRVL